MNLSKLDIPFKEKCLTIEGVYLTVKRGRFDKKLEQVLEIIKINGYFTSLNLSDFKKLLFSGKTNNGKEISDEIKTEIKKLIKTEILSKIDLLKESDYDNFLDLFFKEQNEEDINKLKSDLSEKVKEQIVDLIQNNDKKFNNSLDGISKNELSIYI